MLIHHIILISLYYPINSIIIKPIKASSKMEFTQQAFRQKFKQLDTQNQGRLSKQLLADLLREFDMEQHRASIQSTVSRFYFYSNRFESTNNSKLPHQKSIEIDEEEQEQEQEKYDEQEVLNRAMEYKLNIEQALKYADFLRNKIKFEIWKKSCVLLELQYHLTNQTQRKVFPLKDPGQEAKVNIIVGKEQPSYNSNLTVSLKKKPSSPNEPVMICVKISTNNHDTSKRIGDLWRSIYQMFVGMFEQEMPDAGEFLKTLNIITQQTASHFLLKIQSNNPQVNEFIKIFSDAADNIFKTTIKLKLDVSLDFNFDIGQFIGNKQSNLYQFLAQNIRIKFNFQGSEYVTALKELMIANKAFEDLSYVNDDPSTLMLIALVNMQCVDLNLHFSNNFLEEKQQQSLISLLGLLSQLKEMMAEFEENMPDLLNLVKEILKFKVEAEIKAYDFTINLGLNIRNLDQLIFKKSVLLAQGQGDEEMSSKAQENIEGNNENNSEDS